VHHCELKDIPCVKYCESKNDKHLCGVLYKKGAKMLSLRELETECNLLYETAEGCEDEDIQTIAELFDRLELDITDKLDATNQAIKRLEKDIEIRDDNIKYNQEKKKSLNNKINSLRDLMLNVIIASGTAKFKGDKTYSVSNRISYNFDNVSTFGLDEQFLRVKTELDKAKITEFIKLGGALDGVVLEDKKALTIR
jgi:hypothetical protein